MISCAIWHKYARVNFRLAKSHEPVGRVQFVVFEKEFRSAYAMHRFQIAREK